MSKIIDLKISPQQAFEFQDEVHGFATLISFCSKHLGINKTDVKDLRILKRSLDARSKKAYYNLRIEYSLSEKLERDIPPYNAIKVNDAEEVHIIGAGPAGLFCALQLIQEGYKPIIFERGKKIRERRRDLAILNKEGIVNTESNYCFGEGGAGTYSDGKLYTRSKKRGDVDLILRALVQFGAKRDILIDAHPHIGTNKLPQLIENIREFILACGGEIHFESKLSKIETDSSELKAIYINKDERIVVNKLVLATGHSARDVFQLLQDSKVEIEAKPFALGVRIEHPQELINETQYGEHYSSFLPPASYRLVKQVEQKGVYSFCMCPGGIIAACATAPNEIVTNGWSPSKRNNPFANSGMVVEINQNDWKELHSEGALAAMSFQSTIEQKAFRSVNPEKNIGQKAPAQNMVDFVESKNSGYLSSCSYFPGIVEASLNDILPSFVHQSLREAFKFFGKKMKHFYTKEANVVGVESRTSSPIRIPRDPKSLNHVRLQNFYPAGEGAGYAGGIVSAAMDGIRVARAIKVSSSS